MTFRVSHLLLNVDGKTPQVFKSYIDSLKTTIEKATKKSLVQDWRELKPKNPPPEFLAIEKLEVQPALVTLSFNIKLEDLLPFIPGTAASFLTALSLEKNYIRLQDNAVSFLGLGINNLFEKKSEMKLKIKIALDSVQVLIEKKDPDSIKPEDSMKVELEGIKRLAAQVGMSHMHSSDIRKKINFEKLSRGPRLFYGQERFFKVYNEEEAKVHAFLKQNDPKEYPRYRFYDSIFFKHKFEWQKHAPVDVNANLWITDQKIYLIELVEKKIVEVFNTNEIQFCFSSEEGISIEFLYVSCKWILNYILESLFGITV